MLWVRGKNFVVTCTRALMGVDRCIYGNCFVGKYFVVCFSTTKILPPEKYPLYVYVRYTVRLEIFGSVIFSVNRERRYSVERNFRYRAHCLFEGVANVR